MLNVEYENRVDLDGNPSGGFCVGTGIHISWQNGPLGRGDERKVPDGAFVEEVIEAARQRLEFYQSASDCRFACRENAEAIAKLEEALAWLKKRTDDREARSVEGLHER